MYQFYGLFVDKFDTPKNSKLAKYSGLKFIFKKPLYLSIRPVDSSESAETDDLHQSNENEVRKKAPLQREELMTRESD